MGQVFFIDEVLDQVLGVYQWIHVNKRGVFTERRPNSEQPMCRLQIMTFGDQFQWHDSCTGAEASRGKRDFV